MTHCPYSVDASFGPWAGPHCRGGLDFTFRFELIFFSLVPAAVFIPTAIWQARPWQHKPKLTRPGPLRIMKTILVALIALNSIAYLVLTSLQSGPCAKLADASASVDFLAVLAVGFLSRHDQIYSRRSSVLTTLYLSTNLLLNIATTRTLWLMRGVSATALIYTVNNCFKLVLLLLENVGKRQHLINPLVYGPEELAGPLGRLIFDWLIPLLRLGYETILTMATLTPLSADLKGDHLASILLNVLKSPSDTSLVWEMFNLRKAFLLPILPRLFLLGFTLAQPFLIFTAVNYTNIPYQDRVTEEGNLLVAAFVLAFIGYALSNALYWHLVNRFMIMVRGSLINLIYASTYSATTFSGDTSSLTLTTVDVEKAMHGFEDIHELWASLAQIVIAVYVLASHMSWACVAPIAVPLVCIFATFPVANRVGLSQKAWNAAVEKRVDLTSYILSHLTEVRMLGIGDYAASRIQEMRAQEITPSHRFRQLMASIIVLSQGTTVLGPLATFALYAIVQQISHNSRFTPAQAFSSLSLINLIAAPISVLIQALPAFTGGLASLSRIQTYVASSKSAGTIKPGESSHGRASHSTTDFSQSGSEKQNQVPRKQNLEDEAETKAWPERVAGKSIIVKQAKFGWTSSNTIIQDAEFELSEGSFTIVTGSVGSGKSTLLLGLLKQTPIYRGDVWMRHSNISFCSQRPWLVSGTIRHNIVCGGRFEKAWYDEVVEACALEKDLEGFPEGDLHEVGNEGGNLSGGQRQRVALARGIYMRNSILLLDEPLRGLDNASTQHIIKRVFSDSGLLRRHNATIVMVTSSRTMMKHVDGLLVTASNGIIRLKSKPDEGTIESILVADSTPEDSDNSQSSQSAGSRTSPTQDASSNLELAEAKADLSRKTGDWSIYSFYIAATGRLNAASFLFFCLSCAFCYQFSTIWIKWWAEASSSGNGRSSGYYLGIYALLCFLGFATLMIAAWISMVVMVTRSASSLHEMILGAVFKAPVSHFDSIDHGVTLNRFNQDMQLVDYALPLAVVNTFLFASICLVQAIIISATTNYMAVAIPFCLGVIYFIQMFYLRTSRQLRLLDIEAKAPLYTNLKETILGMSTIRAYGGEFGLFLKHTQRQYLDDSQQPIYLLYTVQRWLSLVLDLLVTGLATLLIVLAVQLKSGLSGADMGVALVNLTSFNQYLTMLVRCWASMETSLGAIARIRGFSRDTPVAEGSGCAPSQELLIKDHEKGQDIVFSNVSATYEGSESPSPSSEDVAHNFDSTASKSLALSSVNLEIAAGTKLAITGRSGSGKSTMISTLFRILPISSGTITIGGQDISKIDQATVQENLIVITQDTCFLPGLSMQQNLDSSILEECAKGQRHERATGYATKEVLENIGLWTEVEERGGLNAPFQSSSWSSGQLQLLSMARAIIKHRTSKDQHTLGWKILVLDEATSSLDEEAGSVMQENIKREFGDHTILAIVHKFAGVMEDMDRMIVLEDGKIARQGSPRDILKDIGN